MLDSTTRKRIDDARDILVGKLPDPKSQVEQITVALIYKFMNDMDREFEDLGGEAEFFTGEYEDYKWSNIVSKEKSGFEKLNLYAEALEKLSLNNNLPALFRNIFKNVFLPYRDPETFNLFMKEINGFSYEHSEDLGDAFEYLLSIMSSQGDAGQFRTPRHIIDFIVDVVQPKKNESILDPACGTAGFLISAYKYIVKENEEKGLTPDEKAKLTENIVGYDISPDMVRLSLVNLYLHLFPNPKIFEYDTLTNDTRWNDTFDVILANPPFMTPKGGIRPHDKFSISAKRSEVLFVDYIMEHLNINGRAGIIVPEGIVFQTANAYKNLRKNLVENNYLWAVVSLPAGVFNPYSGVKTSILLMDKEIAKKTDNILFVRVDNDGYDLGAQRKQVTGSDVPKVLDFLNDYKKNIYMGETIKFNEEDYEFAVLASKCDIKAKDYILVGERYREKEVYLNAKYPMVELKEVCKFIRGPFGGSLKKEIFVEEGYLVYEQYHAINDDYSFGRYFIDENKFQEMKRFEVETGDILISCSGTMGKVSIVPEQHKKGIINQALLKLTPSNVILGEYVKRYLQSPIIQNKYFTNQVGAAIQNVASVDTLKRIRIPLPPLSVQEQIVEQIESCQKIIDGAKRVVDNYQPTIKIDPSWEMVRLGDVCSVLNGYAFKSQLYCDYGIQIVKMGNVQRGRLELDKNISYYPESSQKEFEKYLLNLGDILISMTGTQGKEDFGNVCMVNVDQKLFLNQRVGKLEINSTNICREFLYFILQMDIFRKQVFKNASGVRQGNISKSDLESFFIPLPSLPEQEKIVSGINEEISIVNQNKRLIEIFERKIKDKIAEVCGE